MARITVEDCLKHVGNRFELVLIAAKRARKLAMTGLEGQGGYNNDKPTILALREIAAGKIIFPDENSEETTGEDHHDTAAGH